MTFVGEGELEESSPPTPVIVTTGTSSSRNNIIIIIIISNSYIAHVSINQGSQGAEYIHYTERRVRKL